METLNTVETKSIITINKQIDEITGALVLIDYLYSQHLINKETYDTIHQKYGVHEKKAS